jgi:hypothetical protein
VQVEPPTQKLATPVTVDAPVDSVSEPVVNCVELTVRFQPLSVPVASVTVVGTV